MALTGRPPKSVDELKIHGNYRKDRHADREENAPKVDGLPEMPDGMDETAQRHWLRIIEHIGATGLIANIDAEEVERAARYWSLWRKLMSQWEASPTSKDARLAAVAAGQEWTKSAAKLGLNPADRMRLRVPKKEKEAGVMSRKRA